MWVGGGDDTGRFDDGTRSRVEAVENRSGVVDWLRPLPIRRSWRRQREPTMGLRGSEPVLNVERCLGSRRCRQSALGRHTLQTFKTGLQLRRNSSTKSTPKNLRDDAERFRIAPRTSQSLRTRLRVRGNRLHGVGRAHASPETTRLHHAARRRGCCVAARGTRAAAINAGDWLFLPYIAGISA